jgi:hypothetical protein
MTLIGKQQRITEVLQEYWHAKAQAGQIPSDGDINPTDLGDLWQHCFLVQRLEGGAFQYIHMGEAIIDAYGDDLTGEEICQKLVGQLHEPLVHDFEEVIERRQPLLKESSFENRKRMDVRYRTVLLPLRRAGTEVEYILGGMKWKAY